MKSSKIGERRWARVALALVLLMCVVMNADAATRRLLLVGDSWPAFMWAGIPVMDPGGRVFQEAFIENGLGQWEEWGQYTTIPTSMAYEWAGNELTPWLLGKLDLIRRELRDNPTIDIVHLCLGGNDFGRADFRTYIDYVEFDMQTIVFGGPLIAGTFTVSFQGATTAPIPFNATAAQVQTALENLSTIGAGNISVIDVEGLDANGGPKFSCSFQGTFAHPPVPSMSANGSNLTIASVGAIDHAGGYAAGVNSVHVSGFPISVTDDMTVTIDGDPSPHHIYEWSPYSGAPVTQLTLYSDVDPGLLSAPVAHGAAIYGYPKAQVRAVPAQEGQAGQEPGGYLVEGAVP